MHTCVYVCWDRSVKGWKRIRGGRLEVDVVVCYVLARGMGRPYSHVFKGPYCTNVPSRSMNVSRKRAFVFLSLASLVPVS